MNDIPASLSLLAWWSTGWAIYVGFDYWPVMAGASLGLSFAVLLHRLEQIAKYLKNTDDRKKRERHPVRPAPKKSGYQ